jgi:NDP-sugar pyrophosphorylase family protein
MNTSPVTAPEGASSREQLAAMRRHVVHQLPIVNETNTVVGLVLIDDLIGVTEKPNWVVLMAGGLGARLRPLTECVPKPMLVVRGKPILESILESLVDEGFRKFYVSVNYRADMIMSQEKPVQKFFINAGIYALSPQALAHIPRDTYFDMPTLFDRLNASGALTIAFPLREYWLDIGRVEDYVQANMQLDIGNPGE